MSASLDRLGISLMLSSSSSEFSRNTTFFLAFLLRSSKKARQKVVCLEDSEDEEDDMSEISYLSREALIYLIREQKNNKMVSYPKNNHNKSHFMPSELGDEKSSSDSSASNSSSNSSVESRFRQDAADKG